MIESIIGHIVINKDVKLEIQRSEVGTKIMGVLRDIATIVTIAVNVPRLKESFSLLTDLFK